MFSAKNAVAGRWVVVIAGWVLLSAMCTARADDKQPPRPADAPPVAQAEPPLAQVAHPVEREMTDFEVFNGRVEAAESVKIISRVTGYLTKVDFKEGDNVKKGDVLFEIDSQPYQAEVAHAEAELRVAQARFKVAQAEYQRGQELVKTNAIGQSELDKSQAAKDEAQAALEAAKANLESHQLTLSFCRIIAPIDGRTGRWNVTPGNLVKQDETVLTTIVSLDPVSVGFDMDERTYLRLAKAARQGGATSIVAGAALPAFVQATDENGFPHEGTVNFVNNEFNPSTGTIAARAILPNVPTKDSSQVFVPGMFVRVRIPVSASHQGLLVSNDAVSGPNPFIKQPFVSVLSDKETVEWRKITLGQLQDDGLRVVEGLKPDDRIVLGHVAQQKGTKIRPELVPMPTNESKNSSLTK
jgi:membrane fusion protein, multidrug efflux system